MPYGGGLGAAVGGQGGPMNDPNVIAYLQALYQQSQQQQQSPPVANSAQVAQPANSTDTLPYSAAYASNQNMLGTALGGNLAAIDAQKPGIMASFGYLASGDLDPNNPFGQAQLLKRNYEQSKTGNTNRYAARGQLYSGALQNAQNQAQFSYQANDANLRNQYQQQLAQLELAKAGAYNNYYQGMAQNNWNLTNAAAQPGNYGAVTPQAPADYGTPNNGVSDIAGVNNAQYQQTYGAGSNWQNAWVEAFKASHGGLTPDEFNYLQAMYQAANGG